MSAKIKKTPELIAKLKPFWKEMREAEHEFQMKLSAIELRMYGATGIEGIEFWMSDMDEGIVGIGNVDRSMELIHDTEFEE